MFSPEHIVRRVWVHVFPTTAVDLSMREIEKYSVQSTYALNLPVNCEPTFKNISNEGEYNEYKELEKLLDKVSVWLGTTRIVYDHHTILDFYSKEQQS